MIGVVVTAHGELAQALVTTARLVVPSGSKVVAVGIFGQDDAASYELRLQAAVNEVAAQTGSVLILTDMFGGTPANIGLKMHQPGRIEVLTGANLPMLIKALQLGRHGENLFAVAAQVRDSGARAIAVASEVLAGPDQSIAENMA